MYIHTPVTKDRVDSKLRRVDHKKQQRQKKSSKAAYEFGYGEPYAGEQGRYAQKKSSQTPKANSVKIGKILIVASLFGVLGVLYLSHVFATQKILENVNQLERQYKEAETIYNDKKLMYERLTGPTYIYPKAKQLGLINGGPAEKVVEINP